MTKRTVKQIHNAIYAPIADLKTYRALPSATISQIDPFLFLNHHGPQTYKPNNNGLPFGPHPHRGMETVTFIIDGDILHRDSGGHESIIYPGGVQWMTAGRGLIHAEVSSEEFKHKGGPLEILQLWVNLPARHKMAEPKYIDLQRNDIPAIELQEGDVKMNLISGTWEGKNGAVEPLADVSLCTVDIKRGGKHQVRIRNSHNVFFYIVRGKIIVNDVQAEATHLVEFKNDGEEITFEALEDSILILGHAEPFNEPVVAQGPFVMNTEEEIYQAYEDYRMGKFGIWRG